MSAARASLAFAILLAAAAGCATQEPALPPAHDASRADHPLTRQECIALAFESAPTAAAWEAREKRASAALSKARTLPNPTLLLEWEDLGLDHGPDSTPSQKTQSVLVSLAEIVALPWRIDAAEFDLAAERARVAGERLALAREVAHAYDELLVARSRSALLRESGEIADRSRAAIAEFARLGQLPRIAADRAEAEVLDAGAEADAAAIAERAAESPRPPAGDSGGELESLLSEAAARRPEIAEALAKYRATLERQHLAGYRIEMLPTIGVGHRRQGTTTSEVASIEVGLPLFDRGQNAVDEASAELLDAAAELRAAALRVDSEVAAAAQALAAAQEFLAMRAEPLARIRGSLRDGTEKLFRAGDATIEDWITTRRDEVKARLGLLEARAAVAAASVDLDAALGRLVPVLEPAPSSREAPEK